MEKDKQVNIVWSSRDYDKFSFIEGNRDINPTKLAKLKESILEESLDKPIDVNEKYQIIDGQHRFLIWRELKMPIVFIVHKGWGLRHVPILNTNQANWLNSDFVKTYIEQGKNDYKIFRDFQDKFGFGPEVNKFLLGGMTDHRGSRDQFRHGEFKVTTLTFAQECATMLADFKDYYPGYKRQKFVMAMVQLFRNKNYMHKHMMHKVKYLSGRILHRPTIDEYIKQMKEIYNYKYTGGFERL